jgi:uncharacterized protein YlxP (DUF503 family)
MVVAVASWRLSIPGCTSLKEKRRVVRSLKDRLRSRFNVSVAETAGHDLWNMVELTVALVATDGQFADSVLGRVNRLIEGEPRAVVVETHRALY